jgi:hypothetical protein
METFRTCDIFILPTDDKFNNGEFVIYKYDELAFINNNQVQGKLACGVKLMDGNVKIQYYHIYITSDEEIKDGDNIEDCDFFLYDTLKEKSIHKCISKPSNKSILSNNGVYYFEGACKKIIASTNKMPVIIIGLDNFETLSKIPQNFIQYFVDEYNKGNIIEQVKVAYLDDSHLRIVNNDHEITVLPIKQNWSKEEVIELLHKYEDFRNYHVNFCAKEDTAKWIEENLI